MAAAAFVFAAALATAAATGLGALPFALKRSDFYRWLGPANAIASGVMLGASASLLVEGISRSRERTAAGALVGVVFVVVAIAPLATGSSSSGRSAALMLAGRS